MSTTDTRKRILINQKESNKQLVLEDYNQCRRAVRGFPVSIHLGTDATCNLRCPMCWQRGPLGLVKQVALSEEYFIKFARQVFPTAQILELNVAGEPLMSALIDCELALAEEYGVKVILTTNGVLLNEKKSRFQAIMRNAHGITFSVDSPHKKTYLSLRVGSDFERVVENMRAFQRYRVRLPEEERPYFRIAMVLMKRNFLELSDMVAFAKEMGADLLTVNVMVVSTPEMEYEALQYNEPALIQESLKAKKLAEQEGVGLLYPMMLRKALLDDTRHLSEGKGKPRVAVPRCGSLWLRAYINGIAQIVTCCAPAHPVMGSLKENTFEEIWNNATYQRMRQGFSDLPLTKVCQACVQEGIFCYPGNAF